MKRQVSSAKLTQGSFGSCSGLSPYEKNYKGCLRMEQRELIFEHQRVAKMPRRDLEDQYINLCDDHYAIKKEHRLNQEKIKRLITKILRISSLSLSDVRAGLNASLVNRPRDLLSFEEKLQLCIFDLEIQNSQLTEKLQTLCKRHGLPAPHHLRPSSEMYTNCQLNELPSNRLRTRARSCNHINGGTADPFKEDSVDIKSPVVSSSPPHALPEMVPEKLVDENSEKVKDLEVKNERLAKLLNDFNEQLDQERIHSKELSYKLKELQIRKHISENIELVNLKEKLEQSKDELAKRLELLESSKERNEKVLIEERLKLAELHQTLTDEEEKTQKLSLQLKQVDGLKRQIEDLREQLIESESEKQSLKTQQERFALLLKESVHQGDRIQTLKDKNILLQTQLDDARANEMAMTHSKNDLVEKIIKIQDENDRISIELEGLRSLLAQDNEYKMMKKKDKVVQEMHIEKNSNLQDVDLGEEVEVKSPKAGSSKNQNDHHSKSPKKELLGKTVAINTEPISILKENSLRQKFQEYSAQDTSEPQSPSFSESPNNSTMENNLTYYDEAVTMDSERTSLIHFASNIKEKKSSKEKIKNNHCPPNHLELLERAALYGPYSGSTRTYPQQNKYLDDQETPRLDIPAEPYPIPKARLSRTYPEDNSPQILINLQSFNFLQMPQSDSTYHIEVTTSPSQSFHSSAFNSIDLDLNFQKRIKVNSNVLQYLSNPDHPIRFLLLEKAKDTDGHSPPSSLSYSSPAADETLTASSNMIQCHEIAYGSIKYAELLNAVSQCSSDRCSTTIAVPFHATRYPHPDTGRLSVRFVIDGVLRIRQLLTNASWSSPPHQT